jgi:hypothetical protein
MNRDDIRQHLLEHLKQSLSTVNTSHPGSIQLMGVYDYLTKVYPPPNTSAAQRIARELMQEFVNNNLLYIGYGDNEGLPWFTPTAHGIECHQ